MVADDLPRVEVKSRSEWRRWLAANHRRTTGIWLVTYKRKAAAEWYLSYDDIVEEAICFGWIDSLPRSLDARRSMRLVAPRPSSSVKASPKRMPAAQAEDSCVTTWSPISAAHQKTRFMR